MLSVEYWLVSQKAGSLQFFEKFPLQLIPTCAWSANKNHFVKNLVSNTYVRNQARASVLSAEGRLTYALSTRIWSLSADSVQCLPACFHPVSSLLWWRHPGPGLWVSIWKWGPFWPAALHTAVQMGVFSFATQITRGKLKNTVFTNNRLEERKYQFQFASERFWVRLS